MVNLESCSVFGAGPVRRGTHHLQRFCGEDEVSITFGSLQIDNSQIEHHDDDPTVTTYHPHSALTMTTTTTTHAHRTIVLRMPETICHE